MPRLSVTTQHVELCICGKPGYESSARQLSILCVHEVSRNAPYCNDRIASAEKAVVGPGYGRVARLLFPAPICLVASKLKGDPGAASQIGSRTTQPGRYFQYADGQR